MSATPLLPPLAPSSSTGRAVAIALGLGQMLFACSEGPQAAQQPAPRRDAPRAATRSIAAPGPPANPAKPLEPTARGRAERWVEEQGLAEHAVGPAATVGIGSASMSRSMAKDLSVRQATLRSAELDACAAIVRARGERIGAAADSTGSSSVFAASDAVTLRGASIIRTEEQSDQRGDVQVVVVVRVDPTATMTPANAPNGPESTSGPIVEHLSVAPAKWPASIPIEQLARNVGARRVAGPDGVPKIIGFGQAEVRTPGGEAMAQRRAEMDAMSAIRMFIDRQVATTSKMVDQASRAAEGTVVPDSSFTEVSGTSRSQPMVMPSSMRVFQWSATSAAGRPMVGVVMLSDDVRAPASGDKPPTAP